MTEKQGEASELPKSVRYLQLDGRDIYLVGTAHVSLESVEDVRQTIEITNPDTICVELCEARFNALQDPENWKKMDIFQVIKEGKAVFLLAQLMMTSFYKQIGEKLGVKPGAEMLEGVELAKQKGAELVLADRDIQTTLKRVWRKLGLGQKLKLLMQMTLSVFFVEDIDAETINRMKEQEQLEGVMENFAKEFPSVKGTLIDERDTFLAQKIRATKGQKIVAVVGAGHVSGIVNEIKEHKSIEPLNEIPEPTIWPRIFKWGIPLLIIGLFIYGFFTEGAAHSVESIYIWILVNGILSAVGAALALGHPLTIFSAFLAAPLTSLNPAIAAGWVSGLVQAWVKKPTVADFERLPEEISSFKGFWLNSVSRILLVVAFSNIGSVIGTAVALPWIVSRLSS